MSNRTAHIEQWIYSTMCLIYVLNLKKIDFVNLVCRDTSPSLPYRVRDLTKKRND